MVSPKPSISRYDMTWVCQGLGHVGFGVSASMAYASWHRWKFGDCVPRFREMRICEYRLPLSVTESEWRASKVAIKTVEAVDMTSAYDLAADPESWAKACAEMCAGES